MKGIVNRRNPAPTDIYIHLPYQLVQIFFHQQYYWRLEIHPFFTEPYGMEDLMFNYSILIAKNKVRFFCSLNLNYPHQNWHSPWKWMIGRLLSFWRCKQAYFQERLPFAVTFREGTYIQNPPKKTAWQIVFFLPLHPGRLTTGTYKSPI